MPSRGWAIPGTLTATSRWSRSCAAESSSSSAALDFAVASIGLWPVAGHAGRGGFDVQCPLMSLAGLLAELQGEPYWTGHTWLPIRGSWLMRNSGWRDRGVQDRDCLGRNPEHPHDRTARSIGSICAVRPDRWRALISSEKRPRPGRQIAELAGRIEVVDLADELDGASGAVIDTAAVIRHLDLVIAVDTSTAHLAGGFGARCSVPLQIAPTVRWLMHRDTTPWYPSMRLFRQREFDVWPPVFAAMADELRPGWHEFAVIRVGDPFRVEAAGSNPPANAV